MPSARQRKAFGASTSLAMRTECYRATALNTVLRLCSARNRLQQRAGRRVPGRRPALPGWAGEAPAALPVKPGARRRKPAPGAPSGGAVCQVLPPHRVEYAAPALRRAEKVAAAVGGPARCGPEARAPRVGRRGACPTACKARGAQAEAGSAHAHWGRGCSRRGRENFRVAAPRGARVRLSCRLRRAAAWRRGSPRPGHPRRHGATAARRPNRSW